MASRNATPQPWQQQAGSAATAEGSAGAAGKGLSLPGGKAGKAPAGRATSADPDGATTQGGGGGGGGGGEKSTDVDSLMDAVGASGVDLGAEEESLRATNDRLHAAAMAAQASQASAGSSGPNPHLYAGVDRSRKQDFIDPGLLAECVKKVAAAFQLKTLEPDTIPLIALATRHRLMSLIEASISARDHRQNSSHFRVPPFVDPSSSAPGKKKRRRDALDPALDEEEDDEDEEMDDVMNGEEGSSKRQKVPAWDTVVYNDPERYLTLLERVDREEERKKRRERMVRDQREQEQRELEEAMRASEAARLALEAEGKGPDGQPLEKSGGKKGDGDDAGGKGEEGGGKKKTAKGKGKAKAGTDGDAPSTPGGKVELDKNGKPKRDRKKKSKAGEAGAAAGGSGTSTPAGLPSTGTKNLADDIKKRLTDQTALRSLGGQKFSWLNAGGLGSPSPAGGLGTVGGAGGLPKPKFGPGAGAGGGLPPPSFTPAGGANGAASTSLLNPANNSSSGLANSTATPTAAANAGSSTSAISSALTTSRLNIPPLHDAQRTQLERDRWEAGHHVVEVNDLLFALERERGMGVGRGSGRNTVLRGRAGVTRGGYRGGAGGGGGYGR
ncbi:hypothetical protein JCM11251_004741 [Rhodosporidiobolus azoricus]